MCTPPAWSHHCTTCGRGSCQVTRRCASFTDGDHRRTAGGDCGARGVYSTHIATRACATPATLHGLAMRIILSDFISLDGVSQAPGGPDEDTDGGFAHGGWSGPFFDPETMGANIGEVMDRTDALLFGRRTWDGMAAAWPGPGRRPVRRPDERHPEVRRVADAVGRRGGVAMEQHDAPRRRRRRDRRDPRRCAAEGGDGGLQVWGSTSLASQLVEHDLVDEYQLMIEPILLGGGKRSSRPTGAPDRWSSCRCSRRRPVCSSAPTGPPDHRRQPRGSRPLLRSGTVCVPATRCS